MDEFGYFAFVFAPLLAFALGGGAWLIQTRANRDIDTVIGSASAREARQSAHAPRVDEAPNQADLFGNGQIGNPRAQHSPAAE